LFYQQDKFSSQQTVVIIILSLGPRPKIGRTENFKANKVV